MKLLKLGLIAFYLVLSSFSQNLFAQEKTTETEKKKEIDHSYKPLTLKLDESGNKYIRFLTWHQFWTRSTQNNPNSIGIDGNPSTSTFDIGLRRSRVLMYAQVSPRFLILTHFGINNQTFRNGGITGANGKKPQLFMHDAWTEYKVVDQLYVGAGLHYWNGISRMSSASTLNFLTIDAPIFNWATIELTDQFARQLGVYAKGKIGKLDYRIALNKPFAAGGLADDLPKDGIARNVLNDNTAVQGYFNYQFFDKESNKLPYFVGTYMGSKKIFNIGAGFHYHPEAIGVNKVGQSQAELQDISLFAVDAFLELPLGKGGITAYSVFYNYNFGDNYLRNVGIMNITGATAGSLGGNAQPTIGTGSIFYTQAGYAFSKFKNGAQFQPFAAVTYKNFEALNEPSTQFDFGANYFINAHFAKITLQYSQRPVYAAGNLNTTRGEIILQTHILL
ncbi:MAG: porin [Flexibacter sp. CG_4_10_14_3_um_filter_32_15]|nr:MAG: porin [Flexibacter sp. CG_4_10_14_3_um_filter_32_15]